MKLESGSLPILAAALKQLENGFSGLPDSSIDYDIKAVEEVLLEVARKMQDNYPYFHPLYAGQMLKPPHPMRSISIGLIAFGEFSMRLQIRL